MDSTSLTSKKLELAEVFLTPSGNVKYHVHSPDSLTKLWPKHGVTQPAAETSWAWNSVHVLFPCLVVRSPLSISVSSLFPFCSLMLVNNGVDFNGDGRRRLSSVAWSSWWPIISSSLFITLLFMFNPRASLKPWKGSYKEYSFYLTREEYQWWFQESLFSH